MKPDVTTIAAHCGDVDRATIERHLARLEPSYFERFSTEAIAAHLTHLHRLSPQNPVELIIQSRDDQRVECTVLAFDHPFEFSLITGVLSATGFRIEGGDVYTLEREQEARQRRTFGVGARTTRTLVRDPHKAAVIIDRFIGTTEQDVDTWLAGFTEAIVEVIALLESHADANAEAARQYVNRLVTRRLAKADDAQLAQLHPVSIEVEQVDHRRTRFKIVGQDTPAFLYALSTALSMHGLSIQRVRIETSEHQVFDEIDVVDQEGRPVTDPAKVERVRLSVLLTKQFTYFLGRSPDPYTALTRFERLTEDILAAPNVADWLTTLTNPRAMADLARLLGASDYLWNDFIRSQHAALLGMLRPKVGGSQLYGDAHTMPLRLEQAMENAIGLAEQQDRLNQFKDREIFRIDLEHILSDEVDFREMSRQLTALAEVMVSAAARLVYDDLVRSYGRPRLEGKSSAPATYAVFGLGKLGGIALGYASDIELLFLYAGAGRTEGAKRDPIANAEFFEQHAKETSRFIRSKRAGIFEVDLRLRPYGKDGPLAASAERFESYYKPTGPAHPFERLALVRMRWIAGDPALGFRIEQKRNNFIYDNDQWDLDALWDVWDRAHREKAQGSRLNAKYSPGALVDLEGAVQLTQVLSASHAPQLRTPRMRESMEALRRAGEITARQYADLAGAYHFLRKLINALRMLRGNAQDLFLPEAQSEEFTHLARRCRYFDTDPTTAAEQLLDDFKTCTAAVRAFMESRFKRKTPGT